MGRRLTIDPAEGPAVTIPVAAGLLYSGLAADNNPEGTASLDTGNRKTIIRACPLPGWLRRLGMGGVLFFLVKGLLWLTLPGLFWAVSP